jgi:magnesium-transporting ATPase (P-type)
MLRNTKFVVGVVTYSGHDTKIMKNSMQSATKRSQLEKWTSKGILSTLTLLILLCTLAASYTIVFNNLKEVKYLELESANLSGALGWF